MKTSRQYRLAMATSATFAFLITLLPMVVFIVPQFYGKEFFPGYNYIVIAGGVLLFVALLFYFTRKYRNRNRLLKQDFPVEWEAILNRQVAYYSTLTEEEKSRFKKAVQLFLGEKTIIGVETEVDDQVGILVAASAIIPVFSYPEWEYDNLSEILIYPQNFNEEFDFTATGSNILGLVTGRGGTMVLSKTALLHGFSIEKDKQNVGFHEFIHKVDGLDGYIDGIPTMLADKKIITRWLDIIKNESDKIREGKSDINPYALTNNAEFFAVAAEYFFENPEAMSLKHPELYTILKEIFKQDTKSRFKAAIKSMFQPGGRKTGRNAPCPCGSGKKYKHCCLDKKIF